MVASKNSPPLPQPFLQDSCPQKAAVVMKTPGSVWHSLLGLTNSILSLPVRDKGAEWQLVARWGRSGCIFVVVCECMNGLIFYHHTAKAVMCRHVLRDAVQLYVFMSKKKSPGFKPSWVIAEQLLARRINTHTHLSVYICIILFCMNFCTLFLLLIVAAFHGGCPDLRLEWMRPNSEKPFKKNLLQCVLRLESGLIVKLSVIMIQSKEHKQCWRAFRATFWLSFTNPTKAQI